MPHDWELQPPSPPPRSCRTMSHDSEQQPPSSAASIVAAASFTKSTSSAKSVPRAATSESFRSEHDEAIANFHAINRQSYVSGRRPMRSTARFTAHGGDLMKGLSKEDNFTFVDIVRLPAFDLFVGIVIILNTSLVGIEQTYDLQERFPDLMLFIESAFLFIYAAELGCRFRAFGVRVCLKDGWIKLDIVLLLSGLLFTWILSPSMLEAVPSSFTNVGVLRTARVFRLARMVRLVVRFQSLWMLMQGLLNSMGMMVSVLLVLIGILYMFACIGFDLIGKHDHLLDPNANEAFVEIAESHFSTLPLSMATIFSFLLFDDVRIIYWPLIMQDPVLVVYFLAIAFTVGIVLSNLITAVMVNGAIEQASQDKVAKALADQRARQRRLEHTMELFRSLDEDNSGLITRDEVHFISEKDASMLEGLTGVRNPTDLFDILDMDSSGEVDMHEFLTVIQDISENPGRLEFLKMSKVLGEIPHLFVSETKKLNKMVRAMTLQIDQLSKGLHTGARIDQTIVFDTPPAASSPIRTSSRSSCSSFDSSFTALGEDLLGHQGRVQSGEAPPMSTNGHAGGLKMPPVTAPSWASAHYESLFGELERTKRQLLQALHCNDREELDWRQVAAGKNGFVKEEGPGRPDGVMLTCSSLPSPPGGADFKIANASEVTISPKPQRMLISCATRASSWDRDAPAVCTSTRDDKINASASTAHVAGANDGGPANS
eukprot:TRINITY_DN17475_c1_g1_i1.p1 TRINITY_DN17475_c1_g1~~TRINITY_DN17475_c1_g1_i1.p1  ORF type:complete len:714 (+),score=85.04 TRINITY_DN17475_c1_g1_i1:94-2235(+)